MKLHFQSDDYGITEGVTCGILKGIRDGLIRNTGMFVNMPSSPFAASHVKDYPECCFGIDINLVAGKPVSPIEKVPDLVKANGFFYTSGEVRAKNSNIPKNPRMMPESMENDPYPWEQVYTEVENQVLRFIELVGKKPGYIHGHSIGTPNSHKAIQEVSRKYDVPYSMEILRANNVQFMQNNWNPRPFPVEQQLQTDVEANVMNVIPDILSLEHAAFICHAGFVDQDIFDVSTYTIIRLKDLHMACSPLLKEFVESNGIQLTTYADLV